MNDSRCTVWRWLAIEPGTPADYRQLKDFHYRGGPPGAIKRVLVARYSGPGLGGKGDSMLAGIIVESLPALACSLRTLALPGHFSCGDRSLSAARLNRELRTISRVVVHPMFRSTGLAVELVRAVLESAETPYIEALAAMGRVHPFFERAGMKAFDRPPHADAVRLVAALAHAKLRPLDLVDTRRIPETPFLRDELRRFTRNRSAAFAHLVAEARTRLLSQPVYYLWKRL